MAVINGVQTYLNSIKTTQDVTVGDDLSVGDDGVVTDDLAVGGTLSLTGVDAHLTATAVTNETTPVVSLTQTPSAATTNTMMRLTAAGSNWSGGYGLEIVSEDASCTALAIGTAAGSPSCTITRGGYIIAAGDIQLTSGGTITTSSNGNLNLLPNGTGYTKVGDATSTSHTLNAKDDLHVCGEFEADGCIYADLGFVAAANSIINTDIQLLFGTSVRTRLEFDSAETVDCFKIGLDATSKNIVICEDGDIGYDFAHAGQTNPTIWLQSANQSATEWVNLAHDQTHARVQTGTGAVLFGSMTPGNLGTPVNGDVGVSGRLEVDGVLYADGNVQSPSVIINNAGSLAFGNAAFSVISPNTTQGQLVWGLETTAHGRHLVICDRASLAKDFDHAGQTNPTVYVHSSTDPDSANDEWISITHDVTDGVIDCGSGTLNLGGTANVNFAGATRTASTVTHDAYVELEVAGVAYKFMLGS